MEATPEAPDFKNEQIDIEELQIERRTAIVNEWLEAASHVAQRSGIAAAEEAADFLAARSALGVAHPVSGILPFRPQGSEFDVSHHVFMTPLLDIDLERLTDAGDWRRAMIEGGKLPFSARFAENNQAIYFSAAEPSGQTGRGLIMLHEAVHAMTEINGLVDRSTPNQFWTEEVEAYRLEYEVMSALGGGPYKKLVECIAETIAETEADENGRIEVSYTFSATDFEAIRQVLGPQTDDDEVGGWRPKVFDNAWSLYFERHSERPVEEFADFLYQKYG